MAETGLGRAAARGLSAGGSAQLVKLLIQLGSVAVMARLLSPEDFGLVAMVMSILGFAELFRDMGLSSAAIQAKTLSDQMRTNLWWLNVASGAFATVLALIAAPLIALGFNERALLPIALALAPTFLLSGATTQFRVSLTRRMQFGRAAVLDIAVQVLGTGTAIVMAFLGFGYWSLVGQQLVGGIVGLIATAWVAGWVPGRYRRGIGTGQHVRLGGAVLGSTLIFAVATSYDTILIGRMFGAHQLGLYNRATNISRGPLKQLASPMNAVLQPVLARTQDDPEKFAKAAQLAQMATATLFGFITAFGVAAREDIVSIMLGPEWSAVPPLFACVLVNTFFMAVGGTGSSMMVARGDGRGLFLISLWAAITDVIVISVGSLWGMLGVAIAVAITPGLNWYIVLRWAQHRTGVSSRPLIVQGLFLMALTLLGALAASAVLALLPSADALVRVIVSVVVVAAIFAAALVVPRVRAQLREVKEIIRRRG